MVTRLTEGHYNGVRYQVKEQSLSSPQEQQAAVVKPPLLRQHMHQAAVDALVDAEPVHLSSSVSALWAFS